ncbi:MAG: hypothetical protein HC918_05915 [Oscillatoriales cyanobacterium SM2_1_8]|nr:hypothetical protein [Oscillatoriales cyanobacterium SM2_1_8]
MAALVWVLGFYGAILAWVLSNPWIAVLAVLIALFSAFVAFAYIHDFLFGKKPAGWSANLPAPNSLREARSLGLGSMVSLVLTGLALLPFTSFLQKEVTEEVRGQIVASVFYVTTAYVYQVSYLLSARRAKPPTKTKRP